MDDSQDYWYETPKTVIALYDFIGTELEQLSIAKGVEYQLLDTTNKQWWLVRNRFGGEGFVPSNYVVEKLLEENLYEEVNDEVDEVVDIYSNDESIAPVNSQTHLILGFYVICYPLPDQRFHRRAPEGVCLGQYVPSGSHQ